MLKHTPLKMRQRKTIHQAWKLKGDTQENGWVNTTEMGEELAPKLPPFFLIARLVFAKTVLAQLYFLGTESFHVG